MKLAIFLAIASVFANTPTGDPYASLTQAEKTLLKPQIEKWIHDQVKDDGSDLTAASTRVKNSSRRA